MPGRYSRKSPPPHTSTLSISRSENPPGPWLLLAFLVALTFLPASPFILQTGTILLGLALLPWLFPPTTRIPRAWIALAVLFFALGFASFLPTSLFPTPAWRTNLESVALPKVPTVVIQWRQALEHHAIFICVIAAALIFQGYRLSASQTKNLLFAFVIASAVWTLLAILLKDRLASINMGMFGFFPNRNHTGTFLAIATTCGLGVLTQAIKDRQWSRLTLCGIAEVILVFTVFTISISRAGLLLCAVGVLIWFVLLGLRYWSANQLKAIGLVLLLAIGSFFIAESRVKSRISDTLEKAATLSSDITEPASTNYRKSVDFRIPIAVDTFTMIADAPLTGVGSGQFRYIFPQYRDRSLLPHFNEALHPESDWLWLAAEYGIPAAAVLFTLTLWIFTSSWKSVRKGRDRAIRGASLAAAALVPIHGLIDVPGHRPALLLLSAFLVMASRHPSESEKEIRNPSSFRWLSIIPLALALRYLGVGWFGLPLPYSERGRNFVTNPPALLDNPTNSNPEITLSNLVKRRIELKNTTSELISLCPMERRLYTFAGITMLPIESERKFSEQSLQMDLLLDPGLPQVAMNQANEWMAIDPQKTLDLWSVALARSKKIDSISQTTAASNRTAQRIRKSSVKNRTLRLKAENLLKGP